MEETPTKKKTAAKEPDLAAKAVSEFLASVRSVPGNPVRVFAVVGRRGTHQFEEVELPSVSECISKAWK